MLTEEVLREDGIMNHDVGGFPAGRSCTFSQRWLLLGDLSHEAPRLVSNDLVLETHSLAIVLNLVWPYMLHFEHDA
jgi:hypothetical protein